MPDLVKVGLNYRVGEEEKRAEPGAMPTDLPSHGMGRCGADCQMEGEHDWLIRQGAVEVVDVTTFGDQAPGSPADGAFVPASPEGTEVAVAGAGDAERVEPEPRKGKKRGGDV